MPFAIVSFRATRRFRIRGVIRVRTCFMGIVCSSGLRVVIRARVHYVDVLSIMVVESSRWVYEFGGSHGRKRWDNLGRGRGSWNGSGRGLGVGN